MPASLLPPSTTPPPGSGDPLLRERLRELIEAASRALGVRVIFRDLLGLAGLERRLTWHLDPACLWVKQDPERLKGCVAFCAGEVIRAVSTMPGGRVHTCPFGHTEAVVPVLLDGQCFGLLSAGPLAVGAQAPQRDGLLPASRQDAEDLRLLLTVFAERCASYLARHLAHRDHDRRTRILDLLVRRHGEDLPLRTVAAALTVSVSRAGHLVKELFGRTYPALLCEIRLGRALQALQSSDAPVAHIARQVGFTDASYFIRRFRAAYGASPQAARERHRREQGERTA
jgi:AraC-like DNA-binding protein